MHSKLPSVLSFIVVGLLWEGAARAGWIANYILPAPSAVLDEIVNSHTLLLRSTFITAQEIVLGFALAVARDTHCDFCGWID